MNASNQKIIRIACQQITKKCFILWCIAYLKTKTNRNRKLHFLHFLNQVKIALQRLQLFLFKPVLLVNRSLLQIVIHRLKLQKPMGMIQNLYGIHTCLYTGFHIFHRILHSKRTILQMHMSVNHDITPFYFLHYTCRKA